MSWTIEVTGNRKEVQEAANNTPGCPDSVRMFIANATAYYTDNTEMVFKSVGEGHEGLISDCAISLEALPVQAEQLPVEPPQAKPK